MADEVHERVRIALRDRGLSQKAFGERLGLDPTKTSKALAGRRRFSIDELRSAADVLGVGLGWLSGDGDSAPPPVPRPPGALALDDVLDGPDGAARRRLLDAAWVLLAERGVLHPDDAARRADVEPTTVRAWYTTPEALLTDTLRLAARHAYERQSAALDAEPDGLARLVRLLDLQLPADGELAHEWVVWLHVWARAATDPALRALHAEAYARWRDTVRDAIVQAREQSVVRPCDADEAASRLTAYVDGLGLQVVTRCPGCTVAWMRDALDDHLRAHLLAPDATVPRRTP